MFKIFADFLACVDKFWRVKFITMLNIYRGFNKYNFSVNFNRSKFHLIQFLIKSKFDFWFPIFENGDDEQVATDSIFWSGPFSHPKI